LCGCSKELSIRPPSKWKAPAIPLVPAGPTIVISVPPGSSGSTIQLPHPQVSFAFVHVNVPASAKAGQAMLVPMPRRAAVDAAGEPCFRNAHGNTWCTQQDSQVAGKPATASCGLVAVDGVVLGKVHGSAQPPPRMPTLLTSLAASFAGKSHVCEGADEETKCPKSFSFSDVTSALLQEAEEFDVDAEAFALAAGEKSSFVMLLR